MTKKSYLNNNGKVVRKFVVRGNGPDEATSLNGKIKDQMYKAEGKLIFEKQILNSYFMVIAFDDFAMMYAWNSMIALNNIKVSDIIACKVLIVENEEKDDKAAIEECSKAKELLKSHDGAVLEETKIEDGKYSLVLFFTDTEKMKAWEKTLGVEGT